VLSAALDGPTARVEVRDTGEGIPQRDLDRVFDRFFRGDERGYGFGLGLAIVRNAVEAMGGTISIDSGPGGTTAAMRLPAAPLRSGR
jgi:signal transduction histidine kinase